MNKAKTLSIGQQRAKEFLECLGNGKSIYQIEADEELNESLEEEKRK